MASSPTVQTCLPLTHSSFSCGADIRIHNDLESDGDMSKARLKLSTGHALLRKQVPKSIFLHPQKPYKRRLTFSGYQDPKIVCKKRRRFTSVALPTKFLLGGNINDPLNLRSLEDEKINQQLNAFTPASSPVPIPRERSQVQVLIPPNIYDPLNLNTGEEIEFNLLTSKHRKRRRHRKSRREDGDSVLEVSTSKAEPPGESSVVVENPSVSNLSDECAENDSELDIPADDRAVTDKIVSPVVPQGSPAKFFKRYHSRSFSKDAEEKSTLKPVAKRRRSKTRLQQHADSIRFRANAQKFCYGNHIIKWGNNENSDQRLAILNKDLFYGKDVMDIGCNSGELTLFIAKHWEPHKIVGIDIDKKLINIAQRKVRTFESKVVSEDTDFPDSMATLYGSLAKVGGVLHLNTQNVPKVSFLEANYVPGCEEYLETQKPEFDVLLCLRVTKWIHLNFGDDGLKMAFKRMFAQLRNGGQLILEPQPWFTYSTSKRITPAIFKTYCELKMRPEKFCEFLLSKEVGFSSCDVIGRIYNSTKVYRQPIYLLTKGFQTPCRRNIQMDVLPTIIPFHSDQWNNNSEEQGSCSMWSDTEFLSSYNDFSHPDMHE